MRLPKPKAGFFIKPSRYSRLRVIVLVFRTVKEFRRYVWVDARRNGSSVRTKHLLACCLGARRRSDDVCVILLPERHLRVETISHEVFHATCRWFQRRYGQACDFDSSGAQSNMRPGNVRTSLEERFAIAHGRLCASLVREARRHKLDL